MCKLSDFFNKKPIQIRYLSTDFAISDHCFISATEKSKQKYNSIAYQARNKDLSSATAAYIEEIFARQIEETAKKIYDGLLEECQREKRKSLKSTLGILHNFKHTLFFCHHYSRAARRLAKCECDPSLSSPLAMCSTVYEFTFQHFKHISQVNLLRALFTF